MGNRSVGSLTISLTTSPNTGSERILLLGLDQKRSLAVLWNLPATSGYPPQPCGRIGPPRDSAIALSRPGLPFSSAYGRIEANQASYPAYILYQTIIVIIGFCVVQWQAGIAVKYVTILVLSLISATLIYDLLVKRTKITGLRFGMRLKAKPPEAPASGPTETSA